MQRKETFLKRDIIVLRMREEGKKVTRSLDSYLVYPEPTLCHIPQDTNAFGWLKSTGELLCWDANTAHATSADSSDTGAGGSTQARPSLGSLFICPRLPQLHVLPLQPTRAQLLVNKKPACKDLAPWAARSS